MSDAITKRRIGQALTEAVMLAARLSEDSDTYPHVLDEAFERVGSILELAAKDALE